MYHHQSLIPTQSKNLHAMSLALTYLGGDPRRSAINVVKLASMPQGLKNTFVLHAVSLVTTHAHVGLLMTELSWSRIYCSLPILTKHFFWISIAVFLYRCISVFLYFCICIAVVTVVAVAVWLCHCGTPATVALKTFVLPRINPTDFFFFFFWVYTPFSLRLWSSPVLAPFKGWVYTRDNMPLKRPASRTYERRQKETKRWYRTLPPPRPPSPAIIPLSSADTWKWKWKSLRDPPPLNAGQALRRNTPLDLPRNPHRDPSPSSATSQAHP